MSQFMYMSPATMPSIAIVASELSSAMSAAVLPTPSGLPALGSMSSLNRSAITAPPVGAATVVCSSEPVFRNFMPSF